MKTSNYGICHICGKHCKLTFEHIPPRDALNKGPARMMSGDELIKKYRGEQSRYRNQQKGMGRYSLCSSCNNNTGQWYAPAYNFAAKATALEIQQNPPKQHGVVYELETDKCKPLAFVKQVIAMFCSILPITEVQRLGFDKLLLDKESNVIDRSLFDLRMYIPSQEGGHLQVGPFIVASVNKETNEMSATQAAEIAAYPFGFILNLTPENPVEHGGSIMYMLNAEYGKQYKMTWYLRYLERTSLELPMPLIFKPLPNTNETLTN